MNIFEKLASFLGISMSIAIIISIIIIIAKILFYFAVINTEKNTDLLNKKLEHIQSENAELNKKLDVFEAQLIKTNKNLETIIMLIDYNNKHTIPELIEKEKIKSQ